MAMGIFKNNIEMINSVLLVMSLIQAVTGERKETTKEVDTMEDLALDENLFVFPFPHNNYNYRSNSLKPFQYQQRIKLLHLDLCQN
jgi:hypothetical protein